MANLHIQTKKKKDSLSLKAVSKDEKFPDLVEKQEDKITFVSEEKTYYVYLNKQEEGYNFHKVYNLFVNFSQKNKRNLNIEISSFLSPELKEELIIQAVSEGLLFGSHQTINYKTDKKEKKEEVNYYLLTFNKNSKKILEKSQMKLEAVNFARDLQDKSPNKLHAEEFAQEIKTRFSKIKEVQTEILYKKSIEKNKMGLLLAVNAGSHHEPRVVILRYKGSPKNKEIIGLVGKGITFDSGGYDLKPSSFLQTMKFDMSGAAAVCAAFLALVKEKPKINVTAVACLTENVIGGHATLTESVITSMSGKTVEINNTDAEGRLVLADGITYAIEKEKATKIITVATLTGAVVVSLGENLTGILTNNREFYREFRQALVNSYERYWELPIIPENTQSLKENTSIADISNISSSRYMGTSNGAAFLQEFVKKKPFIHCDIAGTAVKTKVKRGTGVMVKSLIELLLMKK